MNEAQLEELLVELMAGIINMADCDDLPDGVPEAFGGLDSVRTFAEADLLTRDRGVVLRFSDHSEFQLTIIRSR